MFIWKAMRDRLPTHTFLTLGRPHLNAQCPRCHHPETTIHILRDCPWAKEVWSQSPGILPLSFLKWLWSNATADTIILHLQLPWHIYFSFLCWNLWLAKNEGIFKHQSQSQHNLIYSTVQAATEFHFLAGSTGRLQVRRPQLIYWTMPPTPYIKLNTYGSAISNSGLAGAGGILWDHSSVWISGFSLHLGLASNNMVELPTVWQGLALAWYMGFKFIQFELDSSVVLTLLIDHNVTYPPNMIPLICDCRNLMDQDWDVQVLHMYHEANACANALAEWGTHQQHILFVYGSCPSFVYVCYVRDLASLGATGLCVQRPNVVDV